MDFLGFFFLERLPSITSWLKIKSGFNARAQAFTFCRIQYGPPLVCQTMLRLSHRSRGSRSFIMFVDNSQPASSRSYYLPRYILK